MTEPGWYNAEGDPPGTTRYWDGSRWIGEPVPDPTGAVRLPSGAELADAGTRIGARAIDIFIIIVISVIVLFPAITDIIDGVNAIGPNLTEPQLEQLVTDALDANAGRFVLAFAIGLVWDLAWVSAVGGTPGKLMLGLRVADPVSGASPPGFLKAALRALNRGVGLIPVIGGLLILLIGLMSLILLFTDDQRRTVMDRIATTVVVKK